VLRAAQTTITRFIDPMGVHLLGDDPAVRRADEVECAVWRAFLDRARECAGETP
jgi:hypothetical protein